MTGNGATASAAAMRCVGGGGNLRRCISNCSLITAASAASARLLSASAMRRRLRASALLLDCGQLVLRCLVVRVNGASWCQRKCDGGVGVVVMAVVTVNSSGERAKRPAW